MFLAAVFYNGSAPSDFSRKLFRRFFEWTNSTTSREQLSNWTNTDSPTKVDFTARPVYGAMWAPVLAHSGVELGLGARKQGASLAAAIFDEVHELAAGSGLHCHGNGDDQCPLLDAWRATRHSGDI